MEILINLSDIYLLKIFLSEIENNSVNLETAIKMLHLKEEILS